jgi:hypothetical protein
LITFDPFEFAEVFTSTTEVEDPMTARGDDFISFIGSTVSLTVICVSRFEEIKRSYAIHAKSSDPNFCPSA